MNKVLTGNSLDVLKTLKDNSVDSVVTDPPYGYSFMGKDWDKAVPSVEIWQECLRVLKPGAFCMVMSAPRSDVQMHMISNLEQAGFRIDFTPIYWTYASGFPKAGNIGKMVDKRLGVPPQGKAFNTAGVGDRKDIQKNVRVVEKRRNPIYPQAKALDGSYAGFQPKPAVEVIIVAMKPLSEKTFVDQALKNGKGITWLDDCRVPTSTQDVETMKGRSGRPTKGNTYDPHASEKQKEWNPNAFIHNNGRFPANLLVSDDVLNDGTVTKSTVDRNPIQRGTSKSWFTGDHVERVQRGDSGSYSRYFDLDKWANTLPFLITPKASKREKNEGLGHLPDRASQNFDNSNIGRPTSVEKRREAQDGKNAATMKNHHPTVKPLKLMSYLITLTTREGDTVLDPFCGSGTTCIAAKMLKRNYIGVEREQEYVEIAEARLKAHEPELTLL